MNIRFFIVALSITFFSSCSNKKKKDTESSKSDELLSEIKTALFKFKDEKGAELADLLAEKENSDTLVLKADKTTGLVALLAEERKGRNGFLYTPDGVFIKKMKRGYYNFKPKNSSGSGIRSNFPIHLPARSKPEKPSRPIRYSGLAPQYVFMADFSEGLAPAGKKSDIFGYIDIKGNYLIEQKYSFAAKFSDGLALVRYNGEFLKEKGYREINTGYINKKGEMLLGPYTEGTYHSFSEGVAIIEKNGKYGFIDKTGKEILAPSFDHIESFREGLAVIKTGELKGVINTKGEIIVKPIYNDISDFQDGMAVITMPGEEPYNRRFGVINSKGELILPAKYDLPPQFQEDLIPFLTDSLWGYLNRKGEIVIPAMFNRIYPFQDGVARVRYKGEGYGFIDKKANWVIPPKPYRYDYKCNNFKEGMAAFSEKGKLWGFIDKTGKVVVEPQFKEVFDFNRGLATVNLGVFDAGVIDKKGHFIIEPKHDDVYRIYEFNEENLKTILKEKTEDINGFIDTEGNIIIMFSDRNEYYLYK